jgi:hypothetical protein
MELPVHVTTRFELTATPVVFALVTWTEGAEATVVAVAANKSMCCDVAT